MFQEKTPENLEKSEKGQPELITAHQLGEYLAEAKAQFKGKLIKNIENRIKSYIQNGQQQVGRAEEGYINRASISAWNAIVDYNYLKQSDLLENFSPKFIKWLEKNIREPNLIKNIEEKIRLDIRSGQEGQEQLTLSGLFSAWTAFLDYTSLKMSGLEQEFSPEFQKWIIQNIKHPQLLKNFMGSMSFSISTGGEKKIERFNNLDSAWNALRGYTFFEQSGLQKEFPPEFVDWLKENIKDQTLIKNANEALKNEIQRGQQIKDDPSATSALLGYAAFVQFKQILENEKTSKEV